MSQIPTLQQLRSRLRIRHLVLLDELGRSLNMHRAAEAMHLSQPALSKLLAEAEELAGQTLFERSHHGVTPTPLGLMMIGRARLLLNELDATHAELTAAASGASGKVRVGVFPVVAHLLAPLTVERLQASHPDLRIELREGLEQQLLPALRAGELDCIVGRLVVEARTPTCNARSCTKRPPRRSAAPRIRWRPAAGWAAPSWTATAGCCRRATPRFTAWWPAPSRRAARAFRRSRWNRAPSSPSCRCCSARRCCRPCRCGWRARWPRAAAGDPAAGLAGQAASGGHHDAAPGARRGRDRTFLQTLRAAAQVVRDEAPLG